MSYYSSLLPNTSLYLFSSDWHHLTMSVVWRVRAFPGGGRGAGWAVNFDPVCRVASHDLYKNMLTLLWANKLNEKKKNSEKQNHENLKLLCESTWGAWIPEIKSTQEKKGVLRSTWMKKLLRVCAFISWAAVNSSILLCEQLRSSFYHLVWKLLLKYGWVCSAAASAVYPHSWLNQSLSWSFSTFWVSLVLASEQTLN